MLHGEEQNISSRRILIRVCALRGVPLENKFLSTYLSEAGYRTALFGKW